MDQLYICNDSNTARFILGEVNIGKPLLCIGLNPSTATIDKADTTISKVKVFAKSLGYDGWVMFNLYPQRSTNPNNLDNEYNQELHDTNLMHIRSVIDQYRPDKIWACWGNIIDKRKYLVDLLSEIRNVCAENDVEFINIGELTKAGHPRHPSRLPYISEPKVFDIVSYLANR